jgi:hypothetical protein
MTVLKGTFYTTKDINVYHQYCIYIMAIRLLVEKTEVFGENHIPVASRKQTLSNKIVSSTPRHVQ